MKPAWQARVLSAILLGCLSAHASPSSPFDRAQRLRAALEAHPESQRTQLAYNRVLDAYRAIYHGNPASPKADASVLAVAELLTEEGRHFSDQRMLRDAIGQYEFLRTQYPASGYRFTALFAEGQIYRRDLVERDEAKKTFQQFLKLYPESPLAQQAKLELNDIHREEHPTRQARHTRGKERCVGGRRRVPAAAAYRDRRDPAGYAVAAGPVIVASPSSRDVAGHPAGATSLYTGGSPTHHILGTAPGAGLPGERNSPLVHARLHPHCHRSAGSSVLSGRPRTQS